MSARRCPCCDEPLGQAVTNPELIAHDENCSECVGAEAANGTPLFQRATPAFLARMAESIRGAVKPPRPVGPG